MKNGLLSKLKFWKKKECIEQEVREVGNFSGEIVGKCYEERVGCGINNVWSIAVKEKKNENETSSPVKTFIYVSRYNQESNIIKMKTLNDAFNKGDSVTIKQYSDGSYSFPE